MTWKTLIKPAFLRTWLLTSLSQVPDTWISSGQGGYGPCPLEAHKTAGKVTDREIFVIWGDVPGEIEHRASRRHWGAALPLHKGKQAGKLGNNLANKTQSLLIGFILLLLVETMQN